jgi:hypothetical protein
VTETSSLTGMRVVSTKETSIETDKEQLPIKYSFYDVYVPKFSDLVTDNSPAQFLQKRASSWCPLK